MKTTSELGSLIAATALAWVGSPSALAQETAPEEDRRGLVVAAEGAFPGYTMFAPLVAGMGVLLLDMGGEVVHRWPATAPIEAAILLEDGDLLRWGVIRDRETRFQGPGVGGGLIERVEWDGEVSWRYELFDDYQLLHHDIALLPNGNVLFLAWEHRFTEDALEWGRDPRAVGEAGMWPDAVYEIRPTPPEGGEVVWEWHVWDHVVQDFDESRSNHGSVSGNPGKVDINAEHRDRPPMTPEEIAGLERIEEQMAALGYGGAAVEEDGESSGPRERSTAPDWLHTNAIDYHAGQDLIVLSTPTLNELWVIDHSTTTEEAATDSGGRWGRGGEILWRWGNPRTYGAGTDADRALSFQHDPTWLATEDPDELRLLVFNNGRVRPGDPYSSVDELVLPFDPERGFVREPGRPFGPEAPVWTYSDPGTFYSSFISGAQRLPNGNTLVCSGAQGRIFEVTAEGRVVWDYLNPYGEENDFGIPAEAIYRATRVAKDHPGLSGREL